MPSAADGRIASGDVSGEIRLWHGKSGAFIKTLARQKTVVGSLSFSPDGKFLLSGVGKGGGYDCHVYDTLSGKPQFTYKKHDNIVLATAISPEGRWAATGGGVNHEIHIWDLKTGKARQKKDGAPLILAGQGRAISAAAISDTGDHIGWGHLQVASLPRQKPIGLCPLSAH